MVTTSMTRSLPGHCRQTEAHLLARLAVLERLTQRRGERDVPRIDVHHLGEHECELFGVAGLHVFHPHDRSQAHAVPGRLGVGQLGKLGKPMVQLAQARLHQLLALQGRLVFGVFPEIPHGNRRGDRLRERHRELPAQLLDLLSQFFPHCLDHGPPAAIKTLPGEGRRRAGRKSSSARYRAGGTWGRLGKTGEDWGRLGKTTGKAGEDSGKTGEDWGRLGKTGEGGTGNGGNAYGVG